MDKETEAQMKTQKGPITGVAELLSKVIHSEYQVWEPDEGTNTATASHGGCNLSISRADPRS